MLNKSGRLRLINTVLTSVPTYYLTVFQLRKWAIKKLDRIRRSFLWRGAAEANGGHCLVRWAKAIRPKKIGGLGILDIDAFSRALRLRWLWFEWVEPERPWVGTVPPVNAVDRQMFRASTAVQLGDGRKASFWQSSWLLGQAPMDIFPDLFRLAWRKNRVVKDELVNQCWTRGLWRMSTVEEMADFVKLWDYVQQIQLSNEPDQIFWKWTSDGQYTSKSAYRAHFNGSFCTFNATAIWKAETEGKHKFFAWLLVQSKILTADKLMARNWPCNPVCALCDQEPETANHLILHCSFAREVWHRVSSWSGELLLQPSIGMSLEDWWNDSLAGLSKEDRRSKAAILIYSAWNIWKARNRQVFYHTLLTPPQVLLEIKKEIAIRKRARGEESS